MNYKEQILSFLSQKQSWSLFTKVRYIYLKLCRDFSYDYRFLYGSEEEKQRIYNYQPDITNLLNFEIVCTSWCRIAKDILECLGLKCEISHDVLPHVFLLVNLPPYRIKLDPIKGVYRELSM